MSWFLAFWLVALGIGVVIWLFGAMLGRDES
jgi:hypothetical protein